MEPQHLLKKQVNSSNQCSNIISKFHSKIHWHVFPEDSLKKYENFKSFESKALKWSLLPWPTWFIFMYKTLKIFYCRRLSFNYESSIKNHSSRKEREREKNNGCRFFFARLGLILCIWVVSLIWQLLHTERERKKNNRVSLCKTHFLCCCWRAFCL